MADQWDNPGEDEGNVVRPIRFVVVTVAALVIAYIVFLFLYVTVIPMIVNR
jgi:hypothetical protein